MPPSVDLIFLTRLEFSLGLTSMTRNHMQNKVLTTNEFKINTPSLLPAQEAIFRLTWPKQSHAANQRTGNLSTLHSGTPGKRPVMHLVGKNCTILTLKLRERLNVSRLVFLNTLSLSESQ